MGLVKHKLAKLKEVARMRAFPDLKSRSGTHDKKVSTCLAVFLNQIIQATPHCSPPDTSAPIQGNG